MTSQTSSAWNARVLWICVLVYVVAVSGCTRYAASIPSGPTSRSISSNAGMGGLHFSYEAWDQGLAIMFVDRVHGDIKGTGNLVDGVDTQGMSVIRSDGIGYEWVLRTTDGVTADLTINGASYDMARGALFAIQLDGDQVVVHQVDRELPGFDHGGQGMRECTAFVNSSPDLIRLVTGEREEDL